MTLPVRRPFHLEATVRLLQRRPSSLIDVWDRSGYRRVLRADEKYFLCTVRNVGSIDAPSLKLSLEPGAISRAGLTGIKRTLGIVLGLEEDSSFALPGVHVPQLEVLEQALRGARPPRFPTLFESFCRIIPYQQLSLDAGGVLVRRFVERFGRHVETPAGPAWAFPEAADVAAAPVGSFAGIGFSRTKIESLRNIAALVAAGTLAQDEIERLPTEAALRRLDALPGIGPWTAAVVLLRGFRRMEVFPGGDVGALRGLRRILGPKVAIGPLVERLGGRRGYLYFYSLGAQLLERGFITPATAEGPREEALHREEPGGHP
jgi:DNA-3-methyladenine glycosylase II